jgi:hypothetical protein
LASSIVRPNSFCREGCSGSGVAVPRNHSRSVALSLRKCHLLQIRKEHGNSGSALDASHGFLDIPAARPASCPRVERL